MNFNYLKFWENSKNVLIVSHQKPDPDALGSAVGLFSFLKSLNITADIFIKNGFKDNLSFISKGVDIKVDEADIDVSKYDLIVVLDCGNFDMVGINDFLIFTQNKKIINIDHHPTNTNFGDENILYFDYSATSEIIYKILESEGFKFDSFTATALLAGLVGDTGFFKHSNTSPQTLEIAGKLLSFGAHLNTIKKFISGNIRWNQIQGWSHVFSNTVYDEKSKALIATVTADDIEKLSIDDDSFEGVVEILNEIPQAKFSAFFRQQGEKVKVSLRSENDKNFEVDKLAQMFGGGGHKLAAGFSINGFLKQKEGVWFIDGLDRST